MEVAKAQEIRITRGTVGCRGRGDNRALGCEHSVVPRQRPKPNSTPDDLAFGINACAMAMQAGYAKSLLYFGDTRNERVLELVARAKSDGIPVQPVDAFRLDQLTGEGVHQGVLVRLRAIEPVDLRQVVRSAGEASLVLVLDGVTDPQNLGAVLRRRSRPACPLSRAHCGGARS